jgi:hypothetical protein
MDGDLETKIVEALRGVALKPGKVTEWKDSDDEPRDITVGDYLPQCWLNEMSIGMHATHQPDPWTEDFLKRCAQAVVAVLR